MLLFALIICLSSGIHGFLSDGDIQGIKYNVLQQCMTNYSNSNQQELRNCIAGSNKADPDLCSFTLKAFNCNLNLIRKTCPQQTTFYQTYNYNIVKTCNSTFHLPGYMPIITSAGVNVNVPTFAVAVIVSNFVVQVLFDSKLW